MFTTICSRLQPTIGLILTANLIKAACSTSAPCIGKVDFKFIKNIVNEPGKFLIDVRNASEIQETGQIPGSINIPLNLLGETLNQASSKTEFYAQFGRPKPAKSTQLIFTCRSGKRARESAEQAILMGYQNIWVYEGSWNDWIEREKDSSGK